MSESDSDSDWLSVPELESDGENETKALFSTFHGSPINCLNHDKKTLGWNLKTLGDEENFNILDFIKCVNYIRANILADAPMSKKEFTDLREEWSKDKYLTPVKSDDAFLCFDWDDIQLEECVLKHVPIPESRYERIKEELNKTTEPVHVMKNKAYFESYSDYSIHAEMLQDKIRTESYRDTIFNNVNVIEGKYIIDVGAGTGILSMFAAKGGAKQVYSMEMSDIAYDCMDIIRENELEDQITVLKGRAEEQLDKVGHCDVIISEWMGYCLLYEGMLDTVIDVRNKKLAKNGLMIPATANLEICLMNHPELWNSYNGFWDNVYGFKMTSMKKRTKNETQITLVDKSCVASELQELIKLDLHTCSIEDLSFTSDVSLGSTINGQIHGVVCSFDCEMISRSINPQCTVLSTSPLNPSTHWKQTAFLFSDPVEVKEGEMVTGKFKLSRNRSNERELKVFIKLMYNGVAICNQEYMVA